jgi:hypothetical protein
LTYKKLQILYINRSHKTFVRDIYTFCEYEDSIPINGEDMGIKEKNFCHKNLKGGVEFVCFIFFPRLFFVFEKMLFFFVQNSEFRTENDKLKFFLFT